MKFIACLFFTSAGLAENGRGGGVRGGSLEPPKFKEVRLHNTLTWPQNAGNPISEGLNDNIFWERMSLEAPTGDHPRRFLS